MIDTIRYMDTTERVIFGSILALVLAFIVALPWINASEQDATARCEAKGGHKESRIIMVKPMIIDSVCVLANGAEVDF